MSIDANSAPYSSHEGGDVDNNESNSWQRTKCKGYIIGLVKSITNLESICDGSL